MSGFVLLLCLYTAAGTGIAVYAGRKRNGDSQESYFIGGRGMSWLISALTYSATTYSSFMMVGLVGLAFSSGIGAMIFELTYLLSTVILLSVYGNRIRKMAAEKKMVSPMELFSRSFGKKTAAAGALISAAALVPYTAAQVIGLSIIFSRFGISYGNGIAIAAALICIWSLIGGLRGVALTDAIQGLFMLAAAVAVLVFAGKSFGGFELSSFPNSTWTPVFFINLTLPWAFFALTNPQVVQRLFIIKNRPDLRKMIVLFALTGAAYTVITCLIGFSAKFGSLNGSFSASGGRDSIIIEIIKTAGSGLGLAVALSIIFASISTSNSIILSLSSMLSRDLLNRKESLLHGRIIIILLTAAVAVFALKRTSYIVELSVSTSRILLCFIPLFFDLFHIRRGRELTGILTVTGGAAAALLFSRMNLALSSVWTLAAAFGFYSAGLAAEYLRNRIMSRKRHPGR